MKVTCFSDTHGIHISTKLNKWLWETPGDLLIFAGDCQANRDDNGVEFINWMATLPYEHKVMTLGNHDFHCDTMINEATKYDNLHVLKHEAVKIGAYNIFGSPYSVRFGNWSFMEDEDVLLSLFKQIPEKTHILVTHCPPLGILDKTISGHTAGSVALRNRLRLLRELKLHVFGHIQEAYGTESKDGVKFVNASVLDVLYSLKNKPISFEI